MRQVLQDARNGEITVADVPAPKLLAGCILVRTAASLLSVGTERASSEFASKNLAQKARMRPDLVREVLNKIGRDGLIATVSAVRSRLDQPTALGYSSAGTVLALGDGINDIAAGDRVACAGAGYAVHAEFACIPRLLAARIPSGTGVSLEHAAFSTVGAVALHGVRTADVKLGDVVGVIGLGLLGQITVQILKSAGCSVIGMDISPERAQLALRMGADAASSSSLNFKDLCLQYTGGHGVDAVLIAAQTASNDPVNLAGEVGRDRGVVVAVGTVGMEIPRRLFYDKELDFRVSRSYGPGRYDSAYEQKGRDYPIGHVRWTENRNMEAFIKLLADRKLNLDALITHRFAIERSNDAYNLIQGKSGEDFLGVLITYPEDAELSQHTELRPLSSRSRQSFASGQESKTVSVGVLGAGSFATATLLPAIKQTDGVEFVGVCAANGSHSRHAAEKFGFRYCVTDEKELIEDPATNTIVIATRHNLHAAQVVAALNAGKNVFCEKPLCLSEMELLEIIEAYDYSQSRDEPAHPPLLMVGFNRRFAPLAVKMKEFFKDIHEPLALHYRINAGFIPADHWLNDPEQGGGRLIGEACHFVDLLCFLTNQSPVEVHAHALTNPGRYSNDNVICSLRFADGSQGTISYLANGDKSYSKERLEVFGGGRVAMLEDFRRLELIKQGRKQVLQSRFRQDKGHRSEWSAFVDAIRSGKESPIPFGQILTSMLATFRLDESRSLGRSLSVGSLPGQASTF